MLRILLAIVVIAVVYYMNPLTNMKSTAINETNKNSIDYIVNDVIEKVDNTKKIEQESIDKVEKEHLK